MELERESVKSAEKADTDEGGEISSEKLTARGFIFRCLCP